MKYIVDPAGAVTIDKDAAHVYCEMWRDFITIARRYDLDTSVGEVLRDINRICRIHRMPEIEFLSKEEFYI